METLVLRADDGKVLEMAANFIKSGELVAIPTETVYGLGANGLDPEAVAKIFAAKGRPQDNPLILHIADRSQMKLFCRDIPESAWCLAQAFWPGPLTMVLPAKDIVPKCTTANLPTVAVRCPDCEITRSIIRAAGVPVAAPSANLSGKPSTTTAQHVYHDHAGKIPLIIDGGPCRVGVESTIIDLTENPPRLLRPGGITPEQLRSVLGEITVDKAVTAQIDKDAVVKAPGMKYRHYAPQCQVLIVSGSREKAAQYIRKVWQPGDRVLCFREELSLYAGCNPLAYGEEANVDTLSAGLFDALRILDDPQVKTVYARCPVGGGVAYAVQNRLKKAAAFRIIDAEVETPPLCKGRCPEQGGGVVENRYATIPQSTSLTAPFAQGGRIIGITGGTGSGKTTFLKVVEEMGGLALDCDAIYHELLKTDKALLAAIEARFPGVVSEGNLDRKALGNLVFSDEKALRDLNEITHGAVKKEVLLRLQNAPSLVAIDAIGLFESGMDALCDTTVAIIAPIKKQIERICQRDGVSFEYAKKRIFAQKQPKTYASLCQHQLHNDKTEEAFREKCLAFLRRQIIME